MTLPRRPPELSHLENKVSSPTAPTRNIFYPRGRKNSSPKRRTSPAASWRSTRAEIGGVSLGTMLDEIGEGAGKVSCTGWSICRARVQAIHAPVPLILSVFVSSMNSIPAASVPRNRTGTWRRIRSARRRSAGFKGCLSQ